MVSNGRGSWIRTNDPLLPKQMRYQTALYPECLTEQISALQWGASIVIDSGLRKENFGSWAWKVRASFQRLQVRSLSKRAELFGTPRRVH